ncbi:hypothetical protein [Actinomadura hibisca]|uniref:hypothetical protein n=1 Tax=Actinomadura hibisca TaxID=68565 RepID=UPI00083541C7|nr:hypothetical protein [Actinomadura hibisca]
MDSYRGSGGDHGASGDGYRTSGGEHGQGGQRPGEYGQVPAAGYGTGAHGAVPLSGAHPTENRPSGGHPTGGYPTPAQSGGGAATGGYPLSDYGSGEHPLSGQSARSSGGYPTGNVPLSAPAPGTYPPGDSGQRPIRDSAQYPARDSGLHSPGGSAQYPARDSGPYSTGGSTQYPARDSGQHLTGGSAQYPAGDSGQRPTRGSGPHPTGGSRPYPTRDSGPYATGGSSPYPSRGSGEYGLGGGRYSDDPSESSPTGGHPTVTGEPRRSAQPGSRRSAAGGGHRTGSGSHRRVERERRAGRKLGLIFAGIATGAGVCVLAAVAILSNVGVGGDRDAGQVVGSGATETTAPAKSERSVVPDACELVGADLAEKLAPKADRTQADTYQSNERQNQCVWGTYIGDRKRQLTLELRAIAGAAEQSPTDAARRTFGSERRDDESGKALLAGQELTDKAKPADLGEESYVVYSVDKGQGSGEAIANARVANVLVTVHYSGSNKGDPLSADDAMDGSVEAARAAVEELAAG